MNRLRKAVSALVCPAYWPALVRGVVPTVEHSTAFVGREFSSIIDVGANKGQFATFAHQRWPTAQLICFEPLPGPRSKLIAVTSGIAEIHPVALGEAEGEAVMHVASRVDSSSLLPMDETQKRMFHMEETDQLSVQVRRLDTVVGVGGLTRPTLLKIDVQGFEYQTLKGAEVLLDAIDAVYVEVSFLELYLGQKLASDVATLLANAGFIEIGRYNVFRQNGQNVQADILFERRQSWHDV